MHGHPEPHIYFYGIAPTVGDTAIGQSIIQGLKGGTGLAVHVNSNAPETFAKLPEVDQAIGTLEPRVRQPCPTHMLPLKLGNLLADIRNTGGRNALPAPTYEELRSVLSGAAAVVLQGGPTWNDRWLTLRKVIERRLFFEVAKHYGARIFQIGVSCGPFAWQPPQKFWMAPLSRAALNMHDVLLLRDTRSLEALGRLGCDVPKLIASTDAAVFLKAEHDPTYADVERRIVEKTGRARVVVCVRDYQLNYPDQHRVRAEIHRKLAETLDVVQKDIGDVYFLGTDYNEQESKRSDLEIARNVQGMMSVTGSTIIDRDVSNAAALKHIYGMFDSMISMRLHPTILALDSGVPCILLSYDQKCDDFFEQMDMSNDAVPVVSFEPDVVAARVRNMLEIGSTRRDISKRFAEMKAGYAEGYETVYRQIELQAARMRRVGVVAP